ncbi:hypothetical protein [Streptomyces xiamenensis]|uniref:hypothetical protein n=1 Tax=Streptomyces xiamenensis TaxID=408015 RepID=UPI003447B6FA
MMTGMSKMRASAMAVPALVAMLVTGCSSDDGGEDPINVPTPSAEETGNGDASAARDEAVLEALFLSYYDALVQLENGEAEDGSVFEGIAVETVIDEQVGRALSFREVGLISRGEPEITQVQATVDEDRGRIEACVNADNWQVYTEEGEVVPMDVPESDATLLLAERGAEGWIISEHPSSAEGVAVTC